MCVSEKVPDFPTVARPMTDQMLMGNGMPRRNRKPTDPYMLSAYFDRDTYVGLMLEDIPAEELHAALHDSPTRDSDPSSSDDVSHTNASSTDESDSTADDGDSSAPTDHLSAEDADSERAESSDYTDDDVCECSRESDGSDSGSTESLVVGVQIDERAPHELQPQTAAEHSSDVDMERE